MLDSYFKMESERRAQGIPPLPLTPEETAEVCRNLESPPAGKEALLAGLLRDRVAPGVDPAAEVKAAWLAGVAKGTVASPVVAREEAVFLLGTMLGGYNVVPLVELLEDPILASRAAAALKTTILVYGAFEAVLKRADHSPAARSVLESWAAGDWFLTRPELPASLDLTVFKVDGEINTDDFSPAKHAATRPDIPLHAQAMGLTRFPGGLATIARFRTEGKRVAFVGDVVGTGSSRKSACNSVLWHIGDDIPFVPNKRRGGVILGGLIAPIFFNTAEDSGALPIEKLDVTGLKTGDLVRLDLRAGAVRDAAGRELTRFELKPATLRDEFRAGGRLNLIIGRALTRKARTALGLPEADIFTRVDNPEPAPGQPFSQAQKIVGQACGKAGVLPDRPASRI